MARPSSDPYVLTAASSALTSAVLAALLLPADSFAQVLFADGFEVGSTCTWSSTTGGSGPYLEAFDGEDGEAWPQPWTSLGGVALADLEGGRARFRPVPSGYSLARLYAPATTRDVEVHFTLVFEDSTTQGIGFYVRQNGGYLAQSSPLGQGYGVFVEGFRGPAIGVWKEEDGIEIPLELLFQPALGLEDGVPYRVRLRVNQVDASSTLLQAKLWPAAETEPTQWHVQHIDDTPVLQGTSGGIVLDSYSHIQSPNPITAHTFVDDIEVVGLCNPLAARGALDTVGTGFQFTEGPVWRGDHLLFSDLAANTIHRLDPPDSFSTFRSPSDHANGLALAIDGSLLAAEHETRRVSITDEQGTVTSLVDTYQGARFNSPNDLAVRSDGTLYFTDPDYGLADPDDRELTFNGLFRRTPAGALTAEWQGVPGANEPNGVGLSPDEGRLYVTDSQAGVLRRYDVAANGTLSNPQLFAAGLYIPDGLCIDPRGNVFVATWDSTVEVFDADGTSWGSIPLPRPASNCAFGGADGRSLYVTAQDQLYRVPLWGSD